MDATKPVISSSRAGAAEPPAPEGGVGAQWGPLHAMKRRNHWVVLQTSAIELGTSNMS
jgi:hypothetical protein